jgi:arylsulfatase A-like enzyme
VSSFPCAGWDLLPTIAELCGAVLPPDLDGLSLVPILDGKGPDPAREFLYWEHPAGGGWQAARLGDWKAVRRNTQRNLPGAIELFDLAHDPGEKRDLAAQQPGIVKRAKQAFATRSESQVEEWNFAPAR